MFDFPKRVPGNYLQIFKSFLLDEYGSLGKKNSELIDKLLSSSLLVDGLVNTSEFVEAHIRCVREINDPIMGIKYGRYLSSPHHGPLGALTSVCANNLEYLEAQADFLEIRMANQVEVKKQGDYYQLRMFHAPEFSEILEFHNQVFFANLLAELERECGFPCTDTIIGFPFSSNVDYDACFDQQVKLNQDFSYVLIPESYAKLPSLHSDPISKELFTKVCEEAKEKVRLGNTIGNSIMALLDTYNSYPSFSYVASLFHITTRTLSNRLAKEDTSYRKIVISHKMDSAKKLLLSTNNTVEVISEKSGYSNVGNFCRAFKNHVGVSPSSYREEHKHGE